MKRSLSALPVLVLTAVLSACGSSSAGSTPTAASAGGGSYGTCTVSGTPGSLKITPVTPGVLTVQTNLPSPGWWQGTSPETINGGYEYCLAADLAYQAGLPKVKVVNVSFDALVAGQTKDYDLAMAQISITDARKKVVEFSAPYYESSIGVLTKSGSDITSANIKDKQLGASVGTTAVSFLKDVLKPTKQVRTFTDTDAMITAVAAGQVDAALLDTAIVMGFAKQSSGALTVVGQYRTGEQYGALYPKASANAGAFSGAITSMKTDGTLDKLASSWLGQAFGGDPTKVTYFTAS